MLQSSLSAALNNANTTWKEEKKGLGEQSKTTKNNLNGIRCT